MNAAKKEALRVEVQRRLALMLDKQKKRVPPNSLPRYDKVFFEGIAWLDSLGQHPTEPFDPAQAIADDVDRQIVEKFKNA